MVNQKTQGRMAVLPHRGCQLAMHHLVTFKVLFRESTTVRRCTTVHMQSQLSLISSVPAVHHTRSLPVVFPFCSSQRTNPREIWQNAKQS